MEKDPDVGSLPAYFLHFFLFVFFFGCALRSICDTNCVQMKYATCGKTTDELILLGGKNIQSWVNANLVALGPSICLTPVV